MPMPDLNEIEPPYRIPAATVVAMLYGDTEHGLSEHEACRRLQRYGANALRAAPPVPTWRTFAAQFQSPLVVLLLIATLISLTVWAIERESAVPYEAAVIFVIVLVNAVLGYIQEERAEQAVAALQAMSAATATVLRDGSRRQIPAANVVLGDLLLVEEGATIAADARLVTATALQTAEASLTGESLPSAKASTPIAEAVGVADRRNMIYSGTVVTRGHGQAIVTAIGMQTEMGKVAHLLQETKEEATPLQREIDRVSATLGWAVLVIAGAIAATVLLIQRPHSGAALIDVLILGVSLAVAAVPEGLATTLTIILALGMQRMVGRHVIIRKLSAVETLGSATVIATDKTGTLTKNEMTVRTAVTASGRVEITGSGYAPDGAVHAGGQVIRPGSLRTEVMETLLAAERASNAVLQQDEGRWVIHGDPTEGALLVAARKAGLHPVDLDTRFVRLGEVPFSSERKLMSTVHADSQRPGQAVVFAKGAPDMLLDRCSHEQVGAELRPLTFARRATIQTMIDTLASEALRTLGTAFRLLPRGAVDARIDHRIERDLVFLGLVGMIDPPRPEARLAVRTAQQAGIRVMMITGDHPRTAAAIAIELGIVAPGARAITGTELERMDEAALRAAVREVPVYARVSPEHKLRIVRALQAGGHVVAMTGDGVNDAPALKAADIGVAMGIAGTDVAKGAADMILTDDNFASIVAAVEEGRAIFANIQKVLRYLLSSNAGEVLAMFFGVVLAGTIGLAAGKGELLVLPLLATQILWINLVTDSGPALALGVDPADPGVMRHPPRPRDSRVIDTRMWGAIGIVGMIMAVGTLLVLDLGLAGGLIGGTGTLTHARTLAFITLVLMQLFNVFNARSDERSAFRGFFRNAWLWGAVLLSAGLQLLVVYVPLLQQAFSVVALSATDWLLCLVVSSSVLWLGEAMKMIRRSSSC